MSASKTRILHMLYGLKICVCKYEKQPLQTECREVYKWENIAQSSISNCCLIVCFITVSYNMRDNT